MPLQHSSNEMLKRMARKVNKQQILELLTLIKQVIPDVVLRTTMITGFPGESEKDHRDLFEFINEVKFDHLGVFTYSPEQNTPSSKLPNRTAPATIKRRFNELMAAQRQIAFARSKSRIGANIEVLIDSELTTQPGTWLARSYAEAPDIDGLVYISSQPDILLQCGKFVSCEVVASNGYDIIAAPVSNPW
jgi:ribosomal protein S12 methylthiotransferase